MFLSLLLLLVSAKDSTHYMNGFFKGRSPNVAVKGELKQGENNVVLLGGNVRDLPSEISVLDLGDTLARSYWVGKLKSPTVVKINPDLPSATLSLFSFGVDKTELNEETSNELFGDMRQSNLNIPFHPADDTSIVTSAYTGKLPNEHGVVGSTWLERGSEVEAFSTARRSSSEVSVMELLQSNYPSIEFVAGCNNEILGRALTQGTSTASHLTQQGYVSTDAKYAFNWDDLKSELATDPFWLSLKDQVDALNLEDPAVQNFLMEMEYFRRVTQNMARKTDQIQVYSLASTSLETMPEHSTALLTIYFATLHQLNSKFHEVYPNGATQFSFIKTPEMHRTEAHTQLEAKLAEMNFDPMNVRLVGRQFQEVCGGDTGLLCISDDKAAGQKETTYQIGVWLMFTMTLAVLFFSCTFCGMNYSSDALLFTKWNREM
jgi:hypothetical protein